MSVESPAKPAVKKAATAGHSSECAAAAARRTPLVDTMNIDRQSRDRFAELLRHFAAGRMTNDEYEDTADSLVRSKDVALRELWWAMWPTYDDLHEHRLTGKYKLPPQGRRTIARMVLFLHSDLPYEWPVPSRLLALLLNVLTLGFWSRFADNIDATLWPFFRGEDLARAAAQPRLLGGTRYR